MPVLERLRQGCVIPAHPLALDASRHLDERRQRALSRYYLEAGAGGLAVGVHTTQFAIHESACGLYEPVLALAAEVARDHGDTSTVMVAGVTGDAAQAVAEAETAARLGYHLALLTPYGTESLDEDALVDRARAVGSVMPLLGFYLQPAAGGRQLSRDLWRRLADLDCVVGIKVAPFNRYATLDVVLGIRASRRAGEVALYTGNDDHIIGDLLTSYRTNDHLGPGVEFVGGLLGQWSLWVRNAVDIVTEAARARAGDDAALRRLMAMEPELTDANAAVFDVAHAFHGCIPGIHEILRRHGLLAGRWCLDPTENLSPGQEAEIDRVWRAYPHLRDDDFIAEHKDRWLSG